MSERRPTPSPVAADVAWASLGTAIVAALLIGNGGIGFTVGGGDLFGYFVPKYQAVTHALFVEHRIPLWNPYEFTGVPLLGSHQANTFYPPTWLSFGLFEAHAAVQVFYILHVFVLAWALTAYLRRHGVPRPVGILGVLIATAGVFTGHGRAGIDHPAFLAATAWFPAILVLWEAAAQSTRPWLGWMAVAVAAQWLAGYPDFSLCTPILLGVIALVGSPTRPEALPPLTRRGGVLIAGLALGGTLAAIQLLPTAEAVAQSARGLLGIDHSALRRLVLLESLRQLPEWTIERVGPGTFLLALLPLLRPTRARLAWAAALAFTLAVGWPPLRWLYLAPVFSSIRFPVAWDLLGGVLWAILACVGLAAGLRASSRWLRWATVVLAILASAQSAHVIWQAQATLRYPMPDAAEWDARAATLAELVRGAPRGDVRIVAARDAAAGSPLRHELPFVAGYEPAVPPSRIADLFGQFYPNGLGAGARLPVYREPRLASLIGVGIAVVHETRGPQMQQAGFEKIGSLGSDEEIYFQVPVPRARIVRRAFVARDPADALARTVDPDRDIAGTVILEEAVAEEFTRSGTPASDHVRITTSEPERVVLETRLDRPGLLVLMDTFSPNWIARIDGEPTPVLRADYAFRAVAVPAGEHRVVFEFHTLALPAGALLTLLSALVVGFLVRPRRGLR